jgi:nucleoside-diphosphate-sugar epimerase
VSNIGTVNIYEAGRICGLERICIASSIAVYGADEEYEPSELPVTEDAPAYLAKGTLAYAAAKVYIEPEYCIKFIRKVTVEPRTLFFPQFCGVATLTEIVRLKRKGCNKPL